MIAPSILKYLVTQKIKDAECLLKGNRHKACIYLMGYAIEYALKHQVCLSLGFAGFPETKNELTAMIAAIPTAGPPAGIPSTIKDIKNHDLSLLLKFSGKQTSVVTNHPAEWPILIQWSPESRYLKERISHRRAVDFVRISKKIITNELL